MKNQLELLNQKWAEVKTENPKLRIRDIASMLGTKEAQLVALNVGNGSIILTDDFKDILSSIHELGEVMALTRNDNAVHERHGVYLDLTFNGPIGLAVNEDIDLRLFMMHWKWGFAVEEGGRKSLQFFDRSGEAVHKIYASAKTDRVAYDALVKKYTANSQDVALLPIEAYPADAEEKNDSEIDHMAFQQEWLALEDTHQFHGLLGRYGLSRTQALRLAPAGHVEELVPIQVRDLLQDASKMQVPIMAFVASKGCIQIHTGTINKVLATGPWFNVLDPDFNLHLREDAIVNAFVVRKPSRDGIVTSVEVFDKKGALIIQFFGKRKPGIPELPEWRNLLSGLLELTETQ